MSSDITFETVSKSEADAFVIMVWRNDPVVLAASYHREPKRWPEFRDEFIGNYFCVAKLPPLFAYSDSARIGYVFFRPHERLGNADETVEISIVMAPEFRGKGLGSQVIRAATEKAFATGVHSVVAEIRRENAVSMRAFEKSGYVLLEETIHHVDDTGEDAPIYRYVCERPVTHNHHEFEILAQGRIIVRAIAATPFAERYADRLADVNRVWNDAVAASHGHLFNGAYLNLERVVRHDDHTEILAHFDEYKFFAAQRIAPTLSLDVRSVGVSGITLVRSNNDEFIVAARRSAHMTQYPGYIELAPSGTVDKSCCGPDGVVNYKQKIIEEFVEETGLPSSTVGSVEGFAFIHDKLDVSYDLCCRLVLTCSPDDVINGILHSDEYVEPQLIERNSLRSFVQMHDDEILPTSKALVFLHLAEPN